MEKSCMLNIKSKYNSLTKAEKRIADFILKKSNDVLKMSAEELANNADTAKSAVVRCCKSLGFDGYTELKLALSADLAKNKKFSYIPYVYEDDSVSEILNKVFSADIKTLHDTAERIDRKTVEKVVDVLAKANMIHIYGIGTSIAIATDFQYRLMQLGYNAMCYTDGPTIKISSMNIKDGDVAIGISHSGRTIATVDALQSAKENGAKTVCITSYPESVITKVSDYSIEIFSDEIQYPMEAISARVAHLSVIDSLAIALSAKDYEKATERYKKSFEIINTLRYE